MKSEDRGLQTVKPPGATVPMPVGKESDITQMAESCLEAVARDKYDGKIEKYKGKTRLEVAVLSLAEDAAWDQKSRTEFLDRILGKPKQRIDSQNLNITLTGFLQTLAEEDEPEEAQVIDITLEPDGDERMFS